jgi:hypothetical protein
VSRLSGSNGSNILGFLSMPLSACSRLTLAVKYRIHPDIERFQDGRHSADISISGRARQNTGQYGRMGPYRLLLG